MGDCSKQKYVLSLDVGSTTIRSHILNEFANSVGSSIDKVTELYPRPGRVEIDPNDLWKKIVRVINDSVQNAGINLSEISSMGISTQRATFITWNRHSGKPYHNFISWKDKRADSLVQSFNSSLKMKGFRCFAWILYLLTRSNRFLAGSNLQLMNGQVTVRLLWILENTEGLQEAILRDEVMFGTLDTWLLYQLTKGSIHFTDVSSASATGFYDPFSMSWAQWAFILFKIPRSILPEVVDSAGSHFTYVDESVLGGKIPIRCSIADQAASVFSSGCRVKGDIKITLGTGSFLNAYTGNTPYAPVAGLYPLVGWRVRDETAYVIEGSSYDTGSVIDWAVRTGILSSPEESSNIASSVDLSDDVFFIPAFSGLQAPINDTKAAAGFLGLKPSTQQAHLVRSILESIVFRVFQLYQVLEKESELARSNIRVDGGVSKNDFICQSIANFTGKEVERCVNVEGSIVGAGLMAGISSGVWTEVSDILKHIERDCTYIPQEINQSTKNLFSEWKRAVSRFQNWYS